MAFFFEDFHSSLQSMRKFSGIVAVGKFHWNLCGLRCHPISLAHESISSLSPIRITNKLLKIDSYDSQKKSSLRMAKRKMRESRRIKWLVKKRHISSLAPFHNRILFLFHSSLRLCFCCISWKALGNWKNIDLFCNWSQQQQQQPKSFVVRGEQRRRRCGWVQDENNKKKLGEFKWFRFCVFHIVSSGPIKSQVSTHFQVEFSHFHFPPIQSLEREKSQTWVHWTSFSAYIRIDRSNVWYGLWKIIIVDNCSECWQLHNFHIFLFRWLFLIFLATFRRRPRNSHLCTFHFSLSLARFRRTYMRALVLYE